MSHVKTYAAPFVALDQVLDLTGEDIRTSKLLSLGEPYFAGHYPDFPIFPGVFILETAHQAVRHWAETQHNQPLIRLVEARSIRFLTPLRPGDRMEVHCRMTSAGSDLEVLAACYRGSDTLAAELKLRYLLEG